MLILSILEILLYLSEHRQEKTILRGLLVPSPHYHMEYAPDFLHSTDPTPRPSAPQTHQNSCISGSLGERNHQDVNALKSIFNSSQKPLHAFFKTAKNNSKALLIYSVSKYVTHMD